MELYKSIKDITPTENGSSIVVPEIDVSKISPDLEKIIYDIVRRAIHDELANAVVSETGYILLNNANQKV